MEGDPIAGGSVYHLADGWDAGAIAAQDWCFVANGETAARSGSARWRRWASRCWAASFVTLRNMASFPPRPQNLRFATKAPLVHRSLSLTDEHKLDVVSLVVTAIGSDRPGIVRQLSQRARASARIGRAAGWRASPASLRHGAFRSSAANADALAAALQGLESAGLRIVIAKTSHAAPAGRRMVMLELEAPDRPGIIRDLSHSLAERGVSIEELHTEIVDAPDSGHTFKVQALLAVPAALANEELQRGLDALASDMMIDIDAANARRLTRHRVHRPTGFLQESGQDHDLAAAVSGLHRALRVGGFLERDSPLDMRRARRRRPRVRRAESTLAPPAFTITTSTRWRDVNRATIPDAAVPSAARKEPPVLT